MKTLYLLLFFSAAAFAQNNSCPKSTLLYSRELFPGTVTVKRAIAMSGFDTECKSISRTGLTFPQIDVMPRQNYQYYPIDHTPQDVNGRDLILSVITDQLINHLIFDRN